MAGGSFLQRSSIEHIAHHGGELRARERLLNEIHPDRAESARLVGFGTKNVNLG
jgi:hypothetical protein